MKNSLFIIKKKISDLVISRFPEVQEAYIFGSVVSGKTNALSDMDIAVFVQDYETEKKKYSYGLQAQIISALMEIFQTNRIDLVILNKASLLLYHRVITLGKRVYCNDVFAAQQREYTAIKKYLDFKPMMMKLQHILNERILNGQYASL